MTPSRNDTVTAHCGICGAALPTGRPRQWCSDACRQAAWRRRNTPPPAPVDLPPQRPRRAGTVYECTECETRMLGAQRCEDCGTFMRRLGPGGTCHGCEDILTIDELLHP